MSTSTRIGTFRWTEERDELAAEIAGLWALVGDHDVRCDCLDCAALDRARKEQQKLEAEIEAWRVEPESWQLRGEQ